MLGAGGSYRREGAGLVKLAVMTGNEGARAFYESHAFGAASSATAGRWSCPSWESSAIASVQVEVNGIDGQLEAHQVGERMCEAE